MSDPIRAEGKFVTVTVRPGAEVTQEMAEEVAAICDDAAERGQRIGEECQAFRAIYGSKALLEVLGRLVTALRAEEQRDVLEDYGRGWR